MKSTTCKGQKGQFLEEYLSQSAALHAAEEIKMQYGHDLAPAQCRTCGYWHLVPVQTRRQCFHCTDSALFQKDLYATRDEAQSNADWLRKEKKIQLYAYKCPHSSGWHLSKSLSASGKSARKWKKAFTYLLIDGRKGGNGGNGNGRNDSPLLNVRNRIFRISEFQN